MFPTSILASMFGFTPFEFFQAEADDKKKVEVNF
jgi:hypothetical protein